MRTPLVPNLPANQADLYDLASDLRTSKSSSADAVWREVDGELWARHRDRLVACGGCIEDLCKLFVYRHIHLRARHHERFLLRIKRPLHRTE